MASVDVLSKGSNFDPELVRDLVSKITGKSAVAKLSGQKPLAFKGSKEFVFDMPNEIDIVAENGAKSHGGATVTPKTVVPIKFEYGARVSDEFLYASEEEQIDLLRSFNDGFAKKFAKGFDLAVMHGLNPRTGSSSAVVGNNHFDYVVATARGGNQITGTANPDTDLEDAIEAIQADGFMANGMALSPAFARSLASVKESGVTQYPEFRFGGQPEAFYGMGVDVNPTVGLTDSAIVGDFDAFRWGIAKQIPVEIIQYGDPDNSGKDLKGYNQIYIRAEVYAGWAILIPDAFARITAYTSA